MIKALAMTVSNRAAAGIYPDRSGPVLADLLRDACELSAEHVDDVNRWRLKSISLPVLN